MVISDLSFSDPQKNLDCDDDLLRQADLGQGGETLRFWESPSLFVVLGRICKEEEDVDLAACQKDGIPVLRRNSGGGTVLQGPGCLNFSFVLAKSRHPDMQSITKSYEFILGRILAALQELGIEGQFRPICDLVVMPGEKKFSGNAQRRGREFILHHGTILYDFDLTLVSRYLKVPPKMPEYRLNRPHDAFVTNISLAPDLIKQAIASIFVAAL